jgi:hypothetical protein
VPLGGRDLEKRWLEVCKDSVARMRVIYRDVVASCLKREVGGGRPGGGGARG